MMTYDDDDLFYIRATPKTATAITQRDNVLFICDIYA